MSKPIKNGQLEAREPLGDCDVMAIARLLGDLAGSVEPLDVRRRRVIEGLGEMVGADGWIWAIVVNAEDDPRPSLVNTIHGGLSDEQLVGLMEKWLLKEGERPVHTEHIYRELAKGKHFTRMRRQVVDDETWYSDPVVKRYRLARGTDDFVCSMYPLSKTVTSAVSLLRAVNREPFTLRDCRVAHIVLANVGWLHEAGFPASDGQAVTEMTPRQRVVLALLIQGYSRREIAEVLSISPHTANDHIKRIYKHFDVNSQIGLIRHFSCGDGRDAAHE